jgi:transcriptional regulator with XRE-family HTH domain
MHICFEIVDIGRKVAHMGELKQGMNMLIGERLRELRKARGLTQEQLAEELGTNPHYISSIERGGRGLGPDLLARYCKFFGIKEEELSQLVRKKEAGYPPLIKMVIDELLELPDYEQARILADLKEKKEKARQEC